MNRGATNMIRKVMDEWIPSFIRNSRVFMYPFFWYWFKGKNIRLYMDFKKIAPKLSEKEFIDCYRQLDCRATSRPTDLNKKSIDLMLEKLDPSASTLLDVGCGRGYWLGLLQKKTKLQLTGCDVFSTLELPGIAYHEASIDRLPFPDKSFDIVTSHHTIEHIRDLNTAISELKRVARKQLIVVTPRQRYYFYSLDLHLHFFPEREQLSSLFELPGAECIDCDGDWCYIAGR